MTTILAIQGDGFAVVGCDNRISYTDEHGVPYQSMTLASNHGKIAPNGKYLLGASGDMRAINILHHAFVPPNPTARLTGEALDGFMANKFIPALRACFDFHGYSMPEGKEGKDHIAQHNSSIMAVVNTKIYLIDGDYSWISDASGIYATGSGSMYGLGALAALIGNKVPTEAQAKKFITTALQIVAKYDPFTGPPFNTFVQT